MSDRALVLIFLINLSLAAPLLFKIVRAENSIKKENDRIERSLEYQKKVMSEAAQAMNRSPRIKALHDKLALLPRDGTTGRNLLRSKILRDVLLISKSKLIAQGILLLSEQEISKRRKNDRGAQEHKV